MKLYFGTRSRFLSAIFLCAFLSTGITTVYADTMPTGAFIVSPVKEEITLAPGSTKTVNITLMNGTPYPLTVTPSYEDIAAETQQSAVDEPVKLLGTQSSKDSLAQSIELPKKSFDLLSGRKVDVPVTITMSRDATPGGRYGSVVWTFKIASAGGATFPANVAVESRIASLFYVRVEGMTREEGTLATFGLFNNAKTTKQPDVNAPIRFQIAYENKGNVHLNPYGRVTVSGMLRSDEVLIVDPWAVLPSATRMREIDLLGSIMPGYYHAHLELNRGYKDIVDERDVAFWVMPTFTQWFVGIILLLLLALLIRRSLKLSRHFVS